MKNVLITILLFITLTPSLVSAQDNISVEELLGNGNEGTEDSVEELEQKRTEDIENELNISIPEYTDNPSHIVTFLDPSEEKVGVELDIDESGYKDINSPYSLPSLSIGQHRLKFRFVDSIGATKVLEYDMVVIPRPPVVKAPQFNQNELLLSGTGLANSEVILTVSIGADNYIQIADIDGDGLWNTSITLNTLAEGIYTIWGYTRKDGYASNPSEASVMKYGEDGSTKISSTYSGNGISFKFNDIDFGNLSTLISSNPDLLILSLSSLLLGGLISAIVILLFKGKVTREEKEIGKKINGKPKEERTLMELFSEDNDNQSKREERVNNKKKEDTKKAKKVKGDDKKKKNAEEKVFTKTDFLKDFKKFDPDNESGKEVKEPTKRDKKDVIITLTSKVEE